MTWLLGLGALALALADVWLLLTLPLPLWLTIAGCAVTAGLGWWIQRGEDLTLWSELEADVRNGRVPTAEAIDAMLRVLAGWALIVPGWLTDLAGGIMMMPRVRQALIEPIRQELRRRVRPEGGAGR